MKRRSITIPEAVENATRGVDAAGSNPTPAPDSPAASGAGTIRIGRVLAAEPTGRIAVSIEDAAGQRIVVARALVPVTQCPIGRQVALGFEEGDPERGLVLGPLAESPPAGPAADTPDLSAHLRIELDGRKLVIAAAGEIEFRCGKATIRLLEDGRIALRGTDVVTRSSGRNRIQGGSVQIN